MEHNPMEIMALQRERDKNKTNHGGRNSGKVKRIKVQRADMKAKLTKVFPKDKHNQIQMKIIPEQNKQNKHKEHWKVITTQEGNMELVYIY